jgi:hypothetical protein
VCCHWCLRWSTCCSPDSNTTGSWPWRSCGQVSHARNGGKGQLDYEFAARRRLYDSFEPKLFQLLELSDYALDRIRNLTNPDVWPELAKSEKDPPTDVRATLPAARYEVVSTLYGLYAPLAVVRSMSRDMPLVDLSLEPRLSFSIIWPVACTDR